MYEGTDLEEKPILEKCISCFKYTDLNGNYFMRGQWFLPVDIEATEKLFNINLGYCPPCHRKMLKNLEDLERKIIKYDR